MKQTPYVVLSIALVISACKSDSTQEANAQTVANGRDTTITFSNATPSKLSSGWSAVTGTWVAALENSNVSLKMTGNDGSNFNIAVFKSTSYQNVEIEAKVKALQG